MPPNMIGYVLGTGFNAFCRCLTPAPTAEKNHKEKI